MSRDPYESEKYLTGSEGVEEKENSVPGWDLAFLDDDLELDSVADNTLYYDSRSMVIHTQFLFENPILFFTGTFSESEEFFFTISRHFGILRSTEAVTS